jgi:tRNA pseudouridine55 synthase
MDGVLIIDKPEGLTSHDVVSHVRRRLGTRRVGHTGTLDPFATGVMVILVGRATRLAQFLDKDEKEYEALVQFGFETDTGDRTGVRKAAREVRNAECGVRNEDVAEVLQRTDWNDVLDKFRGDIEQVPPMYSAKKIAGRRLYEHARRGEIVERPPLSVHISRLEIADSQSFRIPHSALRIEVVCSAGTYIRTLAKDIGKAVGTGAHLAELRRTRSGRFRLADAVELRAFEQIDNAEGRLLPIDAAVDHLAVFHLDAARVERTRQGVSTRVANNVFHAGEPVRMVSPDGELLAIGVYRDGDDSIHPTVVLSS